VTSKEFPGIFRQIGTSSKPAASKRISKHFAFEIAWGGGRVIGCVIAAGSREGKDAETREP
jgi:hypothetical protein